MTALRRLAAHIDEQCEKIEVNRDLCTEDKERRRLELGEDALNEPEDESDLSWQRDNFGWVEHINEVLRVS